MKNIPFLILAFISNLLFAQCDENKPVQFKANKAILDTSCYSEIATEYNRLKMVEMVQNSAISQLKKEISIQNTQKAILVGGLTRCDSLASDFKTKYNTLFVEYEKENNSLIKINSVLDKEKPKKYWWCGGGVVGGIILTLAAISALK